MRSVLIFIAAASAASGQNTTPDDFKISTTVDLVMLDVGVKDAGGRFLEGLTQSNFHIFDNGKPQPVRYFGHADLPVTLGLVVDNSGSMRNKRAHVDRSAVDLIRAGNPNDQVFIVNFNDKVQFGLPPEMPFSGQLPQLFSALSDGKSEGRTQLYEAVGAALKHVEQGENGRKALVVISDGGDNASKLTWLDLKQRVQSSNAAIYTIGIFDADDPDRNPGILRQLADLTGGEYFYVNDYSELKGVCQTIAQDIRNRYMLAFTPPQDLRAGVHRLRVTVTAPPTQGRLSIRTRADYRSQPAPVAQTGAR